MTTAHREEHDHAIGKIIGTVGKGVTADWVAVAMILTPANRITFRNVELFNCSADDARTNLVGMLVEAYDFANAQYAEINDARLATLEECRSIVEQSNA